MFAFAFAFAFALAFAALDAAAALEGRRSESPRLL